jgi:L-threonylcarbamoyladenylate synthase
VESTIVDLTGPDVAILRPGGVSAEALTDALGVTLSLAPRATRVPGTLAAHYAPTTRLIVTDDLERACAEAEARGLRVGRLTAGDPRDHARRLYAALRDLDGRCDLIVAEQALPGGLGDAVNDRLRRAAAAFPAR